MSQERVNANVLTRAQSLKLHGDEYVPSPLAGSSPLFVLVTEYAGTSDSDTRYRNGDPRAEWVTMGPLYRTLTSRILIATI